MLLVVIIGFIIIYAISCIVVLRAIIRDNNIDGEPYTLIDLISAFRPFINTITMIALLCDKET